MRRVGCFLMGILVAAPILADAELARSAHWLRLLHYRQGVSEVDGPAFFLHDEGHSDPRKELLANLEAFSSERAPTDLHPICRFPLRFRWLNRRLGNPWTASLDGCQAYQSFREKLSAKTLTLMFSTHRPGDPSSAFGHTFLKVSRFEADEPLEMLDYGVSFGANTKSESGWTYVAKGLTGGFRGTFSTLPYYYKVREYSDFESRDVMSYPLQLGQEQVEDVIDHLWELQGTYFDYFYLRENCAYRILSLLQVATTEDILEDFRWWTIPSETIRLLRDKNLVIPGRGRPSARSRLLRGSRRLSREELKLAWSLVQGRQEPSASLAATDDTPAARVLDTAIDAFDYLYASSVLAEDPETMARKHRLLRARARNPIASPAEPTADSELATGAGHPAGRLTLSSGYVSGHGKLLQLELRPAYHDWLDPAAGKPPTAASEFGTMELTHREHQYGSSAVVIERFTLFSLRNYPTTNFWEDPLASEFTFGVDQRNQRLCQDCPRPLVTAAFGKSFGGETSPYLFGVLLHSALEFHQAYDNSARLELGPKLLVRYLYEDRLSLGLELTYGLNSYGETEIFSDQLSVLKGEGRVHLTKSVSLSASLALSRFRGLDEERFLAGAQYFY